MNRGQDFHEELTEKMREAHAMTMRNPLDGEHEMVKPAIVPEKSYRFTWPGQPPKVVSGKELATIVKGADPAMLNIEETTIASRVDPVEDGHYYTRKPPQPDK